MRCHNYSKFLHYSKHGFYYRNCCRITNWNYETKQRKCKRTSKYLLVLEKLRKSSNSQWVITRVVNTNEPTAPTASHSLTHNETVKMTPQTYQYHACRNTSIMTTTPSITPSALPPELQISPFLQYHIITQDVKDNPMTINFINHQVWHNHSQHLHVKSTP